MAQDKFYYPYNGIALKYIDQQIVKQIIKAYKRGDQIKKIKEDFPDAPITNSLYVNLPYELTDEKCICGHFIYRKITGRAAYKDNVSICPNCWHNENAKYCECQYCSEKRLIAEKKENKDFIQRWTKHCESLTTLKKKISDFDLNDVLDLLVIFSYDYLITYKDNQFSFISYNSSHNELLSFKNSDPELIISFQSLVKRHILIPLKELNPKNIEILKSYHTLSNIPFHFAKWKLNIDNDPVSVNMDIKEWVSKRSYNEDELNFFWLEPYHSELSQYLQDQAKENLGLNLTELEILSISEYLSEIYPLSKAFNLIYFSVSSALRFQVQKKPNEKILRNYLVKKILNMAEEKKGNLHIIKDFNRPANISTSLKGQIIRKNIFKLDSDHFTLAKTSVIDSVDRKHPFI